MARRELDEWFWQMGSELQRLSEEFSRSSATLVRRRFWEPRVDVVEDETCVVIKVEIAGVRGEDIQIVFQRDRHSVLIRGVRREEEYPDLGRTGIYQLEIYYGDFEREIRLPELEVEPSGIKAHYRNGFLVVLVPKVETGPRTR